MPLPALTESCVLVYVEADRSNGEGVSTYGCLAVVAGMLSSGASTSEVGKVGSSSMEESPRVDSDIPGGKYDV